MLILNITPMELLQEISKRRKEGACKQEIEESKQLYLNVFDKKETIGY